MCSAVVQKSMGSTKILNVVVALLVGIYHISILDFGTLAKNMQSTCHFCILKCNFIVIALQATPLQMN